MLICISYIKSKMYFYSDVKLCRYDGRNVKTSLKFPWINDFIDRHFIFRLIILAFCIVYNLTMNSEFENFRKKVINWQSFFKSSLKNPAKSVNFLEIILVFLRPKKKKVELVEKSHSCWYYWKGVRKANLIDTLGRNALRWFSKCAKNLSLFLHIFIWFQRFLAHFLREI